MFLVVDKWSFRVFWFDFEIKMSFSVDSGPNGSRTDFLKGNNDSKIEEFL